MATIEKKIAAKARAHQRYRLADGTIVPGVTTVLHVMNKPQLVKWANDMGLQGIDSTAYRNETGRVGTLAHQMIQEYLGGPEWDREAYDATQVDLAENAVLSFHEWERQTGSRMKTVFIEKQLVSENLRYGGTIDWYGEIDGRLWLVDIKTSNALRDENMFQVAAYWQMMLENGYAVDGARVLRVGRTEDEGFDDHVLDLPKLRSALSVFEAALDLYRAKSDFDKFERNEKRAARAKKVKANSNKEAA